ncbi:MAG: hypothetical protein O7C59_11455 [Rickettsia endosymbiont of Ixodes persulcatus]|nr:hypothetical protein [Rickettsia endosymbiont of Ixodes persulcatus]MCZ6914975.1 hypothetical protein [Rickettsia endosymbiont of Ixodes persulcatus]
MDTIDNSPIDCNNLLAPIKIYQLFNESRLEKEANLYTIANLSLKDPISQVKFQFLDLTQPLDFAYLHYQYIIHSEFKNENVTDYDYNQREKRSVEAKTGINLQKEATNDEQTWKNRFSRLLGTSSIIDNEFENKAANSRNLLYFFNESNSSSQEQKNPIALNELNEQLVLLQYLLFWLNKMFFNVFSPVKPVKQFASYDSMVFFKMDNETSPSNNVVTGQVQNVNNFLP